MLLFWIALCLMWPGTLSFRMLSSRDGLCLEDTSDRGLQLKSCSLDSVLQQWMWTDQQLLMNAGSLKCLSAIHTDPVRTVSCESAEQIQWRCKDQQLIGLVNGLSLSTEKGKITLSRAGQHMWRSVDTSDICQKTLRSRRDSDLETDEFDFAETSPEQRMTEAQMKFLQWYYRTEDPTPWKFGMLAFAFLGLLIGAMLIVMGMMANRNRKQIAKYKASTKVKEVKTETEELQVIITDNNEEKTQHNTTHNSGVSDELKPGEIMVTWRDGNVSTLYPEPADEGQAEEDVLKVNEAYEDPQNTTHVITSSETIAF
ncbi:solute carrier family 51 subunit beta [Danio aesculapii]|uniref:solute carrier family 51 subunit beta n=1 Tax=Danio aesculapii TaxID=1142201 RepID=UPI0024C009A5|nr:solute carrier family 51 subunit beta [Danio aesculapii]XP_056317021.1 solute carrier family 51 subunit beta [Danio aesculapii]